MNTEMKMRTKSINQNGFSLIEMLMVVAIMAIVAAIAIPFFGGFLANRDLKSAARDIVGDVYELRQRAISENTWYQITFNQGANNYVIRQCNANDTAFPCNGNDIATKLPSAFRSDISISAVNINGGAILQMQSGGIVSPTTGGSVQLINGRGSVATVTIKLTGRTYVDWALQ